MWLSQLPPAAVYAVLAVLAAVENVIPPVPSDAAVALGAFLTNRGLTTPLGVFAVTWLANLAGAAAVYYGARRYGRRLFATRTGRRLLAPRSLAVIEREYLRFGVAGIFVSRFLPGIRAVVPPFAGLVGLSPLRTFVPMALASGIWYGGLIVLASLIGSNWARINQIVLGVNRTLGIAALALIVAGVVWYFRRRRARSRERVWHATEDALDPAGPSFMAGSEIVEGSARQAAAMLVLELAYADQALTPADRELVASHLRDRWGLAAESPPLPEAEHERRTRFMEYATRLRKRFGQSERLALVERMWTVAFSDGAIGHHEERLMHLAGELLGIPQKDLIEVRGRLQTPARE
ncbi:MAG TPA: TerB family tellurite resistance protein [Gemmatimonadales bacterium]|nr:TerB family tellurite resistance protein [Gemmatimonadales bacterium]